MFLQRLWFLTKIAALIAWIVFAIWVGRQLYHMT